MESWTNSLGFPVLHVEYNRETGEVKMTQERYLLSSSTEAAPKTKWWVPVNILTYENRFDDVNQKSFAPDTWLNETEQTLTTTDALNLVDQEWIILNKGQSGYYRVNYDEDLWNQIILQLHGKIEEPNKSFMTISKLLHPAQIQPKPEIQAAQRAQLIDDSLDLACTSRLSYKIPLELLKYLSTLEHDFAPWEAAHNGLNRLYNAISGTEYYGRFLKYIQTLVESKYTTLTLTERQDEKEIDNYLRRNIIEWACRGRLGKCLTETKNLLAQHLSKTEEFTVSPFLQSTIIKNGLRTSDKSVVVELLSIFSELDANTKSAIIEGIGASQIEDVQNFIKATLLTATGEKVEDVTINYSVTERTRICISIINNNVDGFEQISKFLIENIEKILEL